MIKVSCKHIRNGRKRDAYKCPVALACKEAQGGVWCIGPSVAQQFVAEGRSTHINLPQKVQNWIRRFDHWPRSLHWLVAKPFEFEL